MVPAKGACDSSEFAVDSASRHPSLLVFRHELDRETKDDGQADAKRLGYANENAD